MTYQSAGAGMQADNNLCAHCSRRARPYIDCALIEPALLGVPLSSLGSFRNSYPVKYLLV